MKGVRIQCERLTAEIRRHMQRALFRDTMYSLFNRLETKRKRVIGERQIKVLKVLLEVETISIDKLSDRVAGDYASRKNAFGALLRDLAQLRALRAITIEPTDSTVLEWLVSICLDWPQQIDESEFLQWMKTMPKGKSFKFLS